MGHKENVLEILKDNEDGLTFAEINIEYISKHNGKELGHDLYNYISRLVDMGLVETFIPTKRTGKILGFRATEKVFKEERKEKALELIEITKDLITKGKITDKQEEVLKEICQL